MKLFVLILTTLFFFNADCQVTLNKTMFTYCYSDKPIIIAGGSGSQVTTPTYIDYINKKQSIVIKTSTGKIISETINNIVYFNFTSLPNPGSSSVNYKIYATLTDSTGKLFYDSTSIKILGSVIVQSKAESVFGKGFYLSKLLLKPIYPVSTNLAKVKVSQTSKTDKSQSIKITDVGNNDFYISKINDSIDTGNYNLSICVTNLVTNCTTCITKGITILPINLFPSKTEICDNGKRSLDLTSLFKSKNTNVNANLGVFKLYAYNGIVGHSKVQNNQLTSSIFNTTNQDGNWDIIWICNGGITEDTWFFKVIVKPASNPDVTFNPGKNIILPNTQVQVTTAIASLKPLATTEWYVEKMLYYSNANPCTFNVKSTPEVYSIQLALGDTNGCKDTSYYTITSAYSSITKFTKKQLHFNSKFEVQNADFSIDKTTIFGINGKKIHQFEQNKNINDLTIQKGVYIIVCIGLKDGQRIKITQKMIL